ncbi:MAG: PSD1 domain-containing protein [Akkermansiaceae bacterium]|nr:PSD1 domain-containing protein [Akkermansiaceae bacterium]
MRDPENPGASKSLSARVLPPIAWALVLTAGGLAGAAEETVTFNSHIRPILSDKCFSCHGFDKTTREAGLRLDTAEGAYAPLEDDSSLHAIVPGDPKASEVWRRITTKDEDDVMPPTDFHKPLSQDEIGLITRWIEQGAKYQEHWSFAPLVKPQVPSTRHTDKVANPVDSFVLANLDSLKIQPSPEADKATLLRRLSLDLTGLPPSPEEVAAFLADTRPEAYAAQVDRLLASPHYGERMAVPWLDVVRFADTVGYHGDQNARVFPYRDYVIDAFNTNKRFDVFTIEQLAGDLLPDATDEQRIATGFLRLNLMTREGGAQPKEYMAKSLGDRVRAVGAAWLGLTTGCAECHDHKFDPVTAKDFYSLGAFFADVRQWGVYADYGYTPNPDLPKVNNDWPFPPEIQARNTALVKRMGSLRTQAAMTLAETPKNETFGPWLAGAKAFIGEFPDGWKPLADGEASSKLETPAEVLPDHSVLLTGEAKKDEVVTVRFPLGGQTFSAIRLEALPDEKNAGKVGRGMDGKFSVTPTYAIGEKVLKLAYAQADRRTPHKYSNGSHDPKLEAEWRSAPALWEEPQDAASHPQTAIYQLAEPLVAGTDDFLTVTLATADLGKFRISITPFGDPIPGEPQAMSPEFGKALQAAAPGSEDEKLLIAAWARATAKDAALPEEFRKLRDEIIACRAGYAHSVVAQTLPADKTPAVHLLPRGDWMTQGEEVQPAVPEFLPHASVRKDGGRLNRLDLAKWMVAEENPLPARHFVNRLWKQFFGKGLSNVLDDIGNQGEWPANPALLDWLASEFRESDWDVKHLVKLMVMSGTYRQESGKRADLAEHDPANRLLAAQSPRRLDAEFVRDNILSISGLLPGDFVGGPSVKPYQPAGYYANLNFPQRDYAASAGSDQYRRGLYTHWQRTFMHPMMAGFDAPSREECSADRLQSNSPQQALILLNDPSFIEAARAFAASLLEEAPAATDADRIKSAILRTLGREPRAGEVEGLAKFLNGQRAKLKAGEDNPEEFLKVGQWQPGATFEPVELAAWTQTCRVLLNLHETLTRY